MAGRLRSGVWREIFLRRQHLSASIGLAGTRSGVHLVSGNTGGLRYATTLRLVCGSPSGCKAGRKRLCEGRAHKGFFGSFKSTPATNRKTSPNTIAEGIPIRKASSNLLTTSFSRGVI